MGMANAWIGIIWKGIKWKEKLKTRNENCVGQRSKIRRPSEHATWQSIFLAPNLTRHPIQTHHSYYMPLLFHHLSISLVLSILILHKFFLRISLMLYTNCIVFLLRILLIFYYFFLNSRIFYFEILNRFYHI